MDVSNPAVPVILDAGIGSASHLAAERLRLAANIDARHIPFRGPVEAFTEVISGRLDFYFLPIAPALPNIKTNKVVALAVSTPTRAALLPDVPTVRELGFASLEFEGWNGLLAPAKTPKEIIAKLNRETVKALTTPDVKERLIAQGFEVRTSTPEEFDAYIKSEYTKWAKIVKASGAKAE